MLLAGLQELFFNSIQGKEEGTLQFVAMLLINSVAPVAFFNTPLPQTQPEGVTPLYGLHRHVLQPQQVCFSAVLVINTISNLQPF